MRSRYTAFTLENAPYLLASWHPDTRPTEMTFDATQRWLGLTILARDKGTQQDATGMVEFVARYKVNGKAHKLHELSRFGRMGGHWVYIDGTIDGTIDGATDEALANDNAQQPMI
jgi:SEC-C motif-containing protein